MARKANREWFLIERRHLEGQPVSSVLDMLRHDAARVESNAPAGFWMFSAPHCCRERWASFGIKIAGRWVGQDYIEPYELRKWAESARQGV